MTLNNTKVPFRSLIAVEPPPEMRMPSLMGASTLPAMVPRGAVGRAARPMDVRELVMTRPLSIGVPITFIGSAGRMPPGKDW